MEPTRIVRSGLAVVLPTRYATRSSWCHSRASSGTSRSAVMAWPRRWCS